VVIVFEGLYPRGLPQDNRGIDKYDYRHHYNLHKIR
jgi:hypothetical protein